MLAKKGEGLSINMVIMIVLGLIALTIAVLFLRGQITKGADKYSDISGSLDKCEGFLSGRKCMAGCSPSKIINPLGDGWADCGKTEALKDKKICCEV